MAAILTERTFSMAGSLVVVAVLLVPFFFAWLVSVYENRLLYYLSEGAEVLTKGNIIASVMTSTAIPCFMVSFGLLGVSALFGDRIGFSDFDPAAQQVTPSLSQALIYIPLTLAVSIGAVVWIRRVAYRKKLAARPEDRAVFLKWVFGLNVLGQVLILGLLWTVLFVFPSLANVPIR
jgi:hypothetical protein